MPALSESNRIAHEVYNANLEEIKKRKGDIVVIDLVQRKVLDVINKDESLTFIQKTADALHRHIYLLNIKSDNPWFGRDDGVEIHRRYSTHPCWNYKPI